jgi:hypothetical protein
MEQVYLKLEALSLLMFIFKSKARGIVNASCLIVTGRDGRAATEHQRQ